MKILAFVCMLTAACLLLSGLLDLNLGFAVDMPSPSWRVKTPMLSSIGQCAVVTGNDGLIYVMGGFSGADPVKTVQAYNIVTDSWASKAQLLVATRGAGIAKTSNGIIYVISGCALTSSYSPITQAYNTTSNTWSAKADIPTPTWMAGAATGNNGKIYVIGGESEDDFYCNKTQIYDPVTNTWANGSDMPTPRSQLGVVKGLDGLIYAMGGYNGTALSTVEAYNPSTDSWTQKASMPTPKLEFGIVLGPDNKIYVIGGGTDYGNNAAPFYDTVEIYDPQTNTWTTPAWSESLMPTARKELGATLGNNGKIYAVGGANGAYTGSNEEASIVLPENMAPTAYIDSVSPNPATVGEEVAFVGHGSDSDGSIVAYKWRSSLNGTIGTSASFTTSTLANGTHTIYFSVKDNSGTWSQETMAVVTVNRPITEDPLYQKNVDLENELNDLQQQNTNLNTTVNVLTGKIDTLTWALLGTGIVTIILVLIIIAAIYMPPKRKPTTVTT